MTENEFRTELLDYLKKNIKGFNIDKEVPIPYKHIYVTKNSHIILEIWCFKQDIAIYKPLFNGLVTYKDSKILLSDCSEIQIIIEKGGAKRTKDVGLPYVIVETKSKQPNSHDIITYSQKVKMIKTIFPYSKFVLCIYGKISPRTFRHGLNFDKIISINNVNDQTELKKFKNIIKKLLNEAKKDLNQL